MQLGIRVLLCFLHELLQKLAMVFAFAFFCQIWTFNFRIYIFLSPCLFPPSLTIIIFTNRCQRAVAGCGTGNRSPSWVWKCLSLFLRISMFARRMQTDFCRHMLNPHNTTKFSLHLIHWQSLSTRWHTQFMINILRFPDCPTSYRRTLPGHFGIYKSTRHYLFRY